MDHKRKTEKNDSPTIAPSMEMDLLDQDATEEEVESKEYTEVTKLVIDRVR